MTSDEANELQVGDVVEWRVRGTIANTNCRVTVTGRRAVALSINLGNKHARSIKNLKVAVAELHKPLDNVTANIYADFLEENAMYHAAQLLREAFPIGNTLSKTGATM